MNVGPGFVVYPAQVRRGVDRTQGVIEFGDVKIDFVKLEAMKGKKRIRLSKREYEVLEYLIKRKGEVVTRNDLLDVVWGYDSFPTTRTVDNFIARIRKQVEKKASKPEHILSIRGAGYRFVE